MVVGLCSMLSAKKVKFAVDMGTFTISPLGIHVMGDFQTIAGYAGGDFNPASTPMTQVGSTTIYTVIVDVPAFQKYEYKFVNGDQSYEAEFVPDQSRVGYNFNDNRWLYVDSLQNDTTFVGAIKFNGNAPAGLTLVRFVVDMQNEAPISTNGVHVAGSFQGNDPAKNRLYSFGNNIYEIIAYLNTGNIQYKYFNGNTAGSAENVPSACASTGNRTYTVSNDSILVTVCYNGCNACVPSSVRSISTEIQSLQLMPNPVKDMLTIKGLNSSAGKITITDIAGKQIEETTINSVNDTVQLNIAHLKSGVYQIYFSSNTRIQHARIIKE